MSAVRDGGNGAMSIDADACRTLGALLTASEARELADRFAEGATLSQALIVVGASRRAQVRQGLRDAGLGPLHEATVPVLRGIEGTHEGGSRITPVWTAPGNLASEGRLTSSTEHYLSRARESVMCATFNFQRQSRLWTALQEVSARPEVSVRIYVDADAADRDPKPWRPTTAHIASAMQGARVFRSAAFDGKQVRSHTKFIAVDHQYLIVTSANFSRPAEEVNIELGLQVRDPLLTQAVERQMLRLEKECYQEC